MNDISLTEDTIVRYASPKEACSLLLDNLFGRKRLVFKTPVEISGYDFIELYKGSHPNVSLDFIRLHTELHISNCVFEGGLTIKSDLDPSLLLSGISKTDVANSDTSYFHRLTISNVISKSIEIRGLCIDSLSVSNVTIDKKYNSEHDWSHSNYVRIVGNLVNRASIQHLNSPENSIYENSIQELTIEGLKRNQVTLIERNVSISDLYIREHSYDLERGDDFYMNKLSILGNKKIGQVISDCKLIKEVNICDNEIIEFLSICDAHDISELKVGNGEIREASLSYLSCRKLTISEVAIEKCLRLDLNNFGSVRFKDCTEIKECIISKRGESSRNDNELIIDNSNFPRRFLVIGHKRCPLSLRLEETFLSSDYCVLKNFDLSISMTDSDLGNTLIQNSKISLRVFENSLMGNVKIDGSSLDTDSVVGSIENMETRAKVLRQIGKIHLDNNSYVESNRLLSLELDNNTEILSGEGQLFNAGILKFQKAVSDYGNNPWKVVLYTLAGGIVFTLLFFVSQSDIFTKIQTGTLTPSDFSSLIEGVIISYIPLLNIKYFFELKGLGWFQHLLILLYSIYYPSMVYLLVISLKKLTQYSKI